MKEGEPFIYLLWFVYSNFVGLPFTWSALFNLKISLFTSMSKVLLICSNTSLLTNFFSVNFSKEIAKLFSRSARNSANTSSSFSVHHLVFCGFSFFVYPYNLLKPFESPFVIIRIDFFNTTEVS